MKYIYSFDYLTDGTIGGRISDSPSDNPTIKKSDNPLPVRALIDQALNIVKMCFTLIELFIFYLERTIHNKKRKYTTSVVSF